MRVVFNLLLLTIPLAAFSQLYIGPGAQMQLANHAPLTLKDVNFVNNGGFFAGNGAVHFSGSTDTYISGSQPVQFYTIRIDKENGRYLFLYRPVGVSNEVQFSQGRIDLNSYDLDLGGTGLLIDESEASHIEGPAGGEVLVTTSLNAPSDANPGNLGAVISSTQDLGSVLIRRGHTSQTLPGGGGILRYYNISPANNNTLAATLRFLYFDAELNGQSEASLAQWRSVDGVDWGYEGFTTRDNTQNYVEKTAIDAFSAWTLSSLSGPPLPVVFTDFYSQCDRYRIILQWKTAQEFNSSHFVVERNTSGVWTAIGQLSAAGNSSTEKNYLFIDNNIGISAYYRIAQYDSDGQVKYTGIVIADCASKEAVQALPTPFRQQFTVTVQSSNRGPATLRIVDASGALIMQRQLNLQQGVNQFNVDLHQAAAGVYLVMIERPDTRQIKTIKLVKQ